MLESMAMLRLISGTVLDFVILAHFHQPGHGGLKLMKSQPGLLKNRQLIQPPCCPGRCGVHRGMSPGRRHGP